MARRRAGWFGKLTKYGEWLGRYGSATTQWANVESSMAFHYKLTLRDILEMSWRRFVVMFNALWPPKDEDTEDDGTQKFDVIKDWNSLVGQQDGATAPKELHQYMKEQGIGKRR